METKLKAIAHALPFGPGVSLLVGNYALVGILAGNDGYGVSNTPGTDADRHVVAAYDSSNDRIVVSSVELAKYDVAGVANIIRHEVGHRAAYIGGYLSNAAWLKAAEIVYNYFDDNDNEGLIAELPNNPAVGDLARAVADLVNFAEFYEHDDDDDYTVAEDTGELFAEAFAMFFGGETLSESLHGELPEIYDFFNDVVLLDAVMLSE